MHGGVYNKHNSKICDNNCTKVRRGEMEVHHCKDLVLYSTVYTVYQVYIKYATWQYIVI